ncbi:hypothetical protein EYR40_003367 [Pleurotus pulmonarius]|nr:hypothetical protein EYR40_003367 [Pleurotus pulmonarius]
MGASSEEITVSGGERTAARQPMLSRLGGRFNKDTDLDMRASDSQSAHSEAAQATLRKTIRIYVPVQSRPSSSESVVIESEVPPDPQFTVPASPLSVAEYSQTQSLVVASDDPTQLSPRSYPTRLSVASRIQSDRLPIEPSHVFPVPHLKRAAVIRREQTEVRSKFRLPELTLTPSIHPTPSLSHTSKEQQSLDANKQNLSDIVITLFLDIPFYPHCHGFHHRTHLSTNGTPTARSLVLMLPPSRYASTCITMFNFLAGLFKRLFIPLFRRWSPHPTMPSEERQAFYLTNPSASNVRGRPDLGSTWLAIPAADVYGEVTVKKEHNAPFAIVVLENGIPETLIHSVTSVKMTIDIEMYTVGIYSDTLDLIASSEIRAYSGRGQQKINGKISLSTTFGYELRQFEVAKGFARVRDTGTLILDTAGVSRSRARWTESKGESLQKLRTTIETLMDTLQSAESSDNDRKVARQVAETTFDIFLDVSMS